VTRKQQCAEKPQHQRRSEEVRHAKHTHFRGRDFEQRQQEAADRQFGDKRDRAKRHAAEISSVRGEAPRREDASDQGNV